MKPVWMIVISVVATAGIIGGGTYYLVNSKATKDKDNLQSQITDLNKKVADAESTTTSTTTTTTTPTTTTPATTDETASWKTYTNSRVGYTFKYPTTNLTLALDESIKYPSTNPANSKTQDLVQFAVGQTSFGIRTYVGEGTSTIESWIQTPNAPRATHDLSQYEKITVGGKTAYRSTGEAFVYVLANGNVYEITGYQNVAPVKISAEPLFAKWVATIQFTK